MRSALDHLAAVQMGRQAVKLSDIFRSAVAVRGQ